MTNYNYKNVIIISIDALRADCVGVNSDKGLLKKYKLKNKLKTPNLDYFASNGVFFNQCVSVAPYTTAAHASILTGKWPYNHSIIDYVRNKLSAPTILSILKERGYSTLFQSDFPYILGPNLGFTSGVDKFVVEREDESLKWIRNNKKNRLACFFHFASAHVPYGFLNLHYGREQYRKKVKLLLKKYNLKPEVSPKSLSHYSIMDFSDEEKILKQNYGNILYEMDRLGLYDEIMDLYIEGINYFEETRFNDFINSLKEENLLDNTLFVIMGDHGETWDKNNKGHNKGDYYNGLVDDIVKVPLIFYGKNLSNRKIIKNQVRIIDIVPTILSILNIYNMKNKFDGVDIIDFNKNPDDLTAYSQHWYSKKELVSAFLLDAKKKTDLPEVKFNSYLSSASVRTNKWKLVQNYSKKEDLIDSRLFSVDNNQEKISIINDNMDIVLKLESKLEKYNKKCIKKLNNIKKLSNSKREEIARQLRLIGYNI